MMATRSRSDDGLGSASGQYREHHGKPTDRQRRSANAATPAAPLAGYGAATSGRPSLAALEYAAEVVGLGLYPLGDRRRGATLGRSRRPGASGCDEEHR